jgi:hypothetical protein
VLHESRLFKPKQSNASRVSAGPAHDFADGGRLQTAAQSSLPNGDPILRSTKHLSRDDVAGRCRLREESFDRDYLTNRAG